MFAAMKTYPRKKVTKSPLEEKDDLQYIIQQMPSLCFSDDSGSVVSNVTEATQYDDSKSSHKKSTMMENSESDLMVMNYLQAKTEELEKANCQLEEEKGRLRRKLDSLKGRGSPVQSYPKKKRHFNNNNNNNNPNTTGRPSNHPVMGTTTVTTDHFVKQKVFKQRELRITSTFVIQKKSSEQRPSTKQQQQQQQQYSIRDGCIQSQASF